MINILVEFTVSNQDIEQCKVLLDELTDKTLGEEGCMQYGWYEVVGQPNVFILIECFADVEAQEFHRNTDHFKDILKGKLEPMFVDKRVKFLK